MPYGQKCGGVSCCDGAHRSIEEGPAEGVADTPIESAPTKSGKGRGISKKIEEVLSPPRDLGSKLENMLQVLEHSFPSLQMVDEPEFHDLSIVMDSGAADHVVNLRDVPGYKAMPGAGSKAGACFIAANGDHIPNKGEVAVKMKTSEEEAATISSTFQVSDISRPLWSVGKICDSGYTVVFDAGHATVYHVESGEQVSVFPRRNGLYVGTMKLKNLA